MALFPARHDVHAVLQDILLACGGDVHHVTGAPQERGSSSTVMMNCASTSPHRNLYYTAVFFLYYYRRKGKSITVFQAAVFEFEANLLHGITSLTVQTGRTSVFELLPFQHTSILLLSLSLPLFVNFN
jgi:hypothetical protein